MKVRNYLASAFITAGISVGTLPANAQAVSSTRPVDCNRYSSLNYTQCIMQRDGVGLFLSVNKYCVEQYGNRWYGTGLIQGQRRCVQKAWWQI